MKVKTGLVWWIVMGIWVLLFTLIGWNTLDPDFGWHVRGGDYITENGISKTDPFSYTMPSYPFIDHEWLTNVLMSKISPWGYWAEAVFFGALAGVFFWLLVPKNKLVFGIIPVMLGTGTWLIRGGVRPQILDWIFLTILLRMLWKEELWVKTRMLIIPLFGLWANLHGGFALGPVILAVAIGLKSWEERRIRVSDVMVWIGGVAATGVNPYGFGLWHEVWMQITDRNLRWSIAEWQPFWVTLELGVWLLAALGGAILKVAKNRQELWKWGVAIGLSLAGLSTLRHIPLMAIMFFLLTTDGLETVIHQIQKKGGEVLARAKKFYLLLILISMIVFAEEVGVFTWRTVAGQAGIFYPVEAVGFLKQKSYPGEIFADYGWGGYLLWQYPEKRVFVDGRMPSWRWDAPDGESDWAFKDYQQVIRGDYEEVFQKYGVKTVLWAKKREKSSQKWLLLGNNDLSRRKSDLIQRLETNGWRKAYEDEVAAVYILPEG